MLVVVGGHARKIGKTSVVAGLIRKLRGVWLLWNDAQPYIKSVV
jgi:cobyrinic acid a,c-diamide synthase